MLFSHPARLAGALAAMLASSIAPHAAPASQWAIDPARTHITFSIDAIGYPRTQGEFRRFDGRITVDFDHPDRSRVEFQVEAQSVDVGSEPVGDYLRSDALLNSTVFKTIAFVSTSVIKIDEQTLRVTGDLTMLGVTHPLSVDVAVTRPNGQAQTRVEFTARAKIDRLEFGMNTGFPLISRNVDLVVASEAVAR